MTQIPRIYQDTQLAGEEAINSTLTLDKEASHHLLNVLRLKIGQPLVIFDNHGGEYHAQIEAFAKPLLRVCIQAFYAVERESNLQLHLGQVIAKGERMDWIIQKAVELGVQEITPLLAERCNVKLSPDRFAKRQYHWQKIAINACQQCGRNRIPNIHPVCQLAEWLPQHDADLALVLHPYKAADDAKMAWPQAVARLKLLIGPEGGFTEHEVASALQHQFRALTLGPRILRSETAAVSTITLCQGRWGDILT